MSASIEDKTRVNDLLKVLDKLQNEVIEIGIFGEDGGDVVLYATYNEFGAPKANIPERSFLRAGFDKYSNEISKTAEKLMDKVLDGSLDIASYQKIIGEFTTGRIKQFLTDLKLPANSPQTVRRKGSSNPLIDTGTMRDRITWRVKPR